MNRYIKFYVEQIKKDSLRFEASLFLSSVIQKDHLNFLICQLSFNRHHRYNRFQNKLQIGGNYYRLSLDQNRSISS